MNSLPASPQLVEVGTGLFTLSPFLARTWTLRLALPAEGGVVRRVRLESPVEVEVVYQNPAEAFERTMRLRRLRTVSDHASAAKFARREFRAGGGPETREIEGAQLHIFEIEHALEGGQGSVVMVEVPGEARWVLLSGDGADLERVTAGPT
jgi:hypothetical protein